MNNIFAFTLSCKQNFSDEGECLFMDDGSIAGRILHKTKVDIDYEDNYYSYNIESTEEDYNALLDGTKKIYKLSDYHISPCNTYYTNNL